MFVIAFTQSIRSLLITLVPASIVTFLAWAIAGSAYASTSDPFRGAIWIFLASHGIPFSLHIPPSQIAGWLTYLPLGAMALPAIAIFNGAKKTSEQNQDENSVWLFATFYTAEVLLLSLLSSNYQVTANWYWALLMATPFIFLVTFFAIRSFKLSPALIYLTKSWAILFGFAGLFLGISLMINFKTVHQLTTVLQPGLIGGILLLLLTLLYLPNFIISTIAYFAGTGFAIGRDTLISPFIFHLGKIPALPVLGALPTGRHPLYIALSVIVIAVGAQVALWTLNSSGLVLRQTVLLFILSSFAIAYLGSGALITHELGTVGPSLWKFPLVISAEFLVGVGAIRLFPLIGRR